MRTCTKDNRRAYVACNIVTESSLGSKGHHQVLESSNLAAKCFPVFKLTLGIDLICRTERRMLLGRRRIKESVRFAVISALILIIIFEFMSDPSFNDMVDDLTKVDESSNMPTVCLVTGLLLNVSVSLFRWRVEILLISATSTVEVSNRQCSVNVVHTACGTPQPGAV